MDARLAPPAPSVAVVPFGARGPGAQTGAAARQLARRIVERLETETAVQLRPVFLVSVPEDSSAAGYLVIGSTPDAELAAGYASSLDCTYALTGTLHEDGDRSLDLALVDAAAKRVLSAELLPVPAGSLQRLEGDVASWLARALGVELADRGVAPAANEDAYRALLEGMDAELNATLLAGGAADAARSARLTALERYVHALAADPACDAAEARLLVMAAESLGTGLEAEHEEALAAASGARPASWKLHYLLGELRHAVGDRAGAIVALEHAHALRPLAAADRIRLAELYLETGTPGPARTHLREARRAAVLDTEPATCLALARALIRLGDRDGALAELERVLAADGGSEVAARARRLRLGLRRPDLERELEAAGRDALEAPTTDLDRATAAFERVRAADPALWEAEFGLGIVARRRDDAVAAERAFRRALDLWPGQPDATHELGATLLLRGDVERAVPLLESAARQRPQDAGYLADAGFAQLRLGRLPEARERLESAARLDADDPLTKAYLAELARVEAQIARPPS